MQRSSDMSGVTPIVQFEDPELFASVVKRINLEVLQTAKGLFRARYAASATGACDIQTGWINQSIFARGGSDPSRLGFLIQLRQSREWNWYGEPMDQKSVGVCSGGCELMIKAAPATRWAFISAAPDSLAQCAQDIYGRELTLPARGPARIKLHPLDWAAIRDLLGDCLTAITSGSLELTALQSLADRALLRLMVRVLLGESSDVRHNQIVQVQRVFRQVNYFVASHPDNVLRLNELCDAIGVSREVLLDLFRRYVGLHPIQYLHTRRLNQVRKALLRADPTTTAVADIARAWGFWHLGSFTRQFTELFGKSPSAVLRQSPRLPLRDLQ